MKKQHKNTIPKLTPFEPPAKWPGFMLDYVDEYIIPVNFGHGIEWKSSEGERFTTRIGDHEFQDGMRIAVLEETKFVGTCAIGAMHYYSSIEFHGPLLRRWKGKKFEEFCGCAGYGPERDKIEHFIGSVRIDSKRRLTKVEKDVSGERVGKKGEWVIRHNTPAEARECGILTFKRRFAPGWVLLADNDETGEREEIART